MQRSLSRRRFLAGTGTACAALVTGASSATADRGAANTDSTSNGHAAPDDVEALVDDLVETSLEEHSVPGATVAVVTDGDVALTKGYGVADRETGDPVDPTDTPFRVGSLSKPVVATALQRLVQRGEIDPDADVTRYLDVPVDDADGDRITLRHLLTHRAGFEATNQGLWIPAGSPVRPLESYLREGPRERVRPPGVAGSYSNYGYALAGSILTARSDRPFHAAIDDLLLSPGGMTSSSFEQPVPAGLADTHATGYGPLGATGPDAFPSVGLRPAGAMSTTATDMARFIRLHLNDGVLDGERVLEPGVVDAMHAQWATHHDRLDGMAGGFVEDTRGDVRTLWHNGATPAFYSHLVLVPAHDLGFFIAYNSTTGGAAANDVVEGLLDEFLPTAEARSLSPDGEPTRAGDLPGTYRSLQQSHTWHDRVTSVLNAPTVDVAVADDGALITSDGSTTTRWVEIEPLVFERVDGGSRLAFGERDGRIEYLFRGGSPTADGRVDGLEQLPIHGALAVATVVGMLSATLGWPTAALWRHSRADGDDTPIRDRLRTPQTRARLVAGGAPVVLLAFPVVAFVHLALALYATISDPPLTFTLLFALPILGALGALLGVTYSARSWLEGYWTTPGRIHYTLVTAALIGYCWLLWYWNLLLPPGW